MRWVEQPSSPGRTPVTKTRSRSNSRAIRQPAGLPADTRIRALTNLGRTAFGFTLSPALQAAVDAGRLSADADAAVREQLIWLRIKRDALSVGARRVREAWQALQAKALTADPTHDPYTLFVGRSEAVTLALDVETVISLLHATLDAAVTLATMVERTCLAPAARTPEATLRTLPKIDQWEQELFRLTRHAFAHSQAPWLAVLLPAAGPPDLAILTRLRPDYAAGEGYLLLSQVERWWTALELHLDALETSLAARLREP